MKGFEICINDAAPIVAMTDSLVTLIISVGYADGDDMHIGGMDSKSNHLIWMNKKMSLGDKIKVRVREIVIVKTCSDSLFSIGQKNCQLFVAKLRNFLDSHNRMVLY